MPGAPGHCEGHNVNAAVMVSAAVALRYAMERFKLPGTLKIFGAPAEEQLLSRPYFVRDGYFDEVDVAFHDHVLDAFKSDYGLAQAAAISADFHLPPANPPMRRFRPGRRATRSTRVVLDGHRHRAISRAHAARP